MSIRIINWRSEFNAYIKTSKYVYRFLQVCKNVRNIARYPRYTILIYLLWYSADKMNLFPDHLLDKNGNFRKCWQSTYKRVHCGFRVLHTAERQLVRMHIYYTNYSLKQLNRQFLEPVSINEQTPAIYRTNWLEEWEERTIADSASNKKGKKGLRFQTRE